MRLSRVSSLSHPRKLFPDPNYKAAKKGCLNSANQLIQSLDISVDPFRYFSGYVCPVTRSDGNRIPVALADYMAKHSDAKLHTDITLVSHRQGSSMPDRIMYQPEFIGPVPAGKYIIVDDYFTTGASLMHLMNYIVKNGGVVINAMVLCCTHRGNDFVASNILIRTFLQKFPDANTYFDVPSLSAAMIRYLLRFNHLQSFYNRYSQSQLSLFV